ncbi:MAG: hypothetical protein J1F64_01980 [Oscillospiraceae bacterium]|nr:hypothetical protein [Oscillospiraceae bacterium]
MKVASIFSDNMVLKSDEPIKIWGKTEPLKIVKAIIGNNAGGTEADENGNFVITLAPMKAGFGHKLTVCTEDEVITYNNVGIGEVWFFSGQSNMEWSVAQSAGAEDALLKCRNEKLRLFKAPSETADEPLEFYPDNISWQESDIDTVKDFSAIAYYFGEELLKDMDVPVGVIMCCKGGSKICEWMSREAAEKSPWVEKDEFAAEHKSKLFNAMMAPIIPFNITGFCWYQGESNVAQTNHNQYIDDQPLFINDIREKWGKDFPFYYVQLHAGVNDTPFMKLACFKDAQSTTLRKVKNTAMAVAHDLGEPYNIHFSRKKDCAFRLAQIAKAKVYGMDVVYQGPCFKEWHTEGRTAYIKLANVDSQLIVSGMQITGLQLAADRDGHGHLKFIDCPGELIEADTIKAVYPESKTPVAVRYSFGNFPKWSVFNKEGFPLAPFRTDNEHYYKNRDGSEMAEIEVIQNISF